MDQWAWSELSPFNERSKKYESGELVAHHELAEENPSNHAGKVLKGKQDCADEVSARQLL
jgi:hypothetical protein